MNWNQLQTVLWLRWRLSRNQWSRGGPLNAVLSVLVITGCGLLVVAASVSCFALGVFVAPQPSYVLLLVWDAALALFLLAWMVSILLEIQRSESIDLRRLLHLPVSLSGIFLLNYVASHLNVMLLLFVPGMLGLALGVSWGRGPRMLLLLPLLFSFFFMITAWTYCLRGWLISLMTNRRKRSTVLVIATFTVVLLGQLPNLLLNVFPPVHHRPPHSSPFENPDRPRSRSGSDEPQRLLRGLQRYHQLLPPLWVAYGAMTLADTNPKPALWATAGAAVIGSLGLLRGYRSTLRFYRDEQKPAPARPVRERPLTRPDRYRLLERKLPGVPEPAAALGLMFFRSMLRAPEVRMALGINLLMPIVLGAVLFSHRLTGGEKAGLLLPSAVAAFTFLGFLQLLLNLFGLDRTGFRALVLLPAPRKYILLGKNLAFLPLALGMGILFLAILAAVVPLSPLVMLSAVLQLLALFLLSSLGGNFFSIIAPFRVAAGSLKPTKTSVKTKLIIALAHTIIFPIIAGLVMLPPAVGLLLSKVAGLPPGLVDLLLSAVLAALAAGAYWFAFDGLGRLLHSREQQILEIVTHEIE